MNTTASKHESLSHRLRRLLTSIIILVVVVMALSFSMIIFYNYRYSAVTSNIIRASQFNQNFKEDVDLKMYYYVIRSDYAEGLPLEEVEEAETLAGSLLQDTKDKDSRRAIESALSLCENLRDKIVRISETEGYEAQLEQLDTNIYILTELIQQYFYTYLYHEAGYLAILQDNLNAGMWTAFIITGFIIFLLVLYLTSRASDINRSITKPITALSDRAEAIGKGDLTAREPVTAEDETLQTLSNSLELMASRLNNQMDLIKQEQLKLRSMELALLQSQINPHFLYNTLDTIIWLVETDKNEQAVEMVTSLSNFFRSSLSKGRDVITLEEEELHVRSYLEIQQVRYKDILTYEIDMDKSLSGCILPKLTLQPLVENALYHGIKLKRGVGSIKVSSREESGNVVLSVRDTGAGIQPERLEKLRDSLKTDEEQIGFGVSTVYRRLKLLLGEECSINIESSEGEGTEVTLSFPCVTSVPVDASRPGAADILPA